MQIDVAKQRACAEGHAEGISRRERLGRRVDRRQLDASQLRRERQNVVRERPGSHVDSVGRANGRGEAAQDQRPDWCSMHRRERKKQRPCAATMMTRVLRSVEAPGATEKRSARRHYRDVNTRSESAPNRAAERTSATLTDDYDRASISVMPGIEQHPIS